MIHTNKQSNITAEILEKLPSPVWLLEEHLLEENLQILQTIKEEAGVKILLALKGFAFWHAAEMMHNYLDGTCASGLHEARLGSETFGGEVHSYSPAYSDTDVVPLARISHHMVFNSPAQLERFGSLARSANPRLSLGLRVNPEYSAAPSELYNPCAPYSRLGTLAGDIHASTIAHIDGFHFHALCEQDADALEATLAVFEEKFGAWFAQLQWVNFGGGHHITRADYDRTKLVSILKSFHARYPHLSIYLEPGEAVGWETGTLIATVLDIVHNGIDIAILDTSAEAHMPDTIIMPYRAEVRDAQPAGAMAHTYRLAGNTCLAGDIMGDYSFSSPLKIGDRIIFEDQMHYTMVKASTFNGIPLPSIAILRRDGEVDIKRNFDYNDFKSRLG